jgi:hypothetical protein
VRRGAGAHRAGVIEFAGVLDLAYLDHLDRPDDVLDFRFLLRAAGEAERCDDSQSGANGRQPVDDGL